jgi:hypothetical protein
VHQDQSAKKSFFTRQGKLPIYPPGPNPAAARTTAMVDEMERLRGTEGLSELLRHYADLAAPDRQVWQDRLAELAGVTPREIAGFHGELLAYGWLEQNTGLTPVLRAGAAPACYRVTTAGLRALKNLLVEPAEVG